MTDRIRIRGLKIETIVGVYGWERRVRQSLELDVELDVDLGPAGASDRVADTIDYKTLSGRIRDHLSASRYHLIETLAADAVEICLADPRAAKATVTVHKPGALRHAVDVEVVVDGTQGRPPPRPAHRAFIGVGSNVDPVENVRAGLAALHERFGAIRVSPTYRTDPVGCPGSPRFVNLVVEVRTDLDAGGVLATLHALEDQRGRERGPDPNAPRTLDLDLLLYDDLVCTTEPPLPHPQLDSMAFVIVPFADLAPDVVHPVRRVSMGALRAELPESPPGMEPLDEVVY